MRKKLDLVDLGKRLLSVDMMLMSFLKRRMDLAREVEKSKYHEEDPEKRKIFRSEVEIKRLTNVGEWAKIHGLNPYFAQSILYSMIGESCKQQMIQLQDRPEGTSRKIVPDSEWHQTLDQNLLKLTEVWSEFYDVGYTEAFFATRAYLQFESEVLEQEIAKLSDRDVFLDIGCATGRLTFQFAPKFVRTIGYDISPHMIAKANSRVIAEKFTQSRFNITDVQKGIPEPDNSVSLAVMNLGTASDVRELPRVLKEIHRVLKPQGRFFLSFYNRKALLYAWDFIPWPVGLEAKINLDDDCLNVHSGDNVLPVYAKAYSVEEVLEIVKGGIVISEIQTYPTVSAILPNDLFENQLEAQKSVKIMDKHLSVSMANGGAYILVTGKKTK